MIGFASWLLRRKLLKSAETEPQSRSFTNKLTAAMTLLMAPQTLTTTLVTPQTMMMLQNRCKACHQHSDNAVITHHPVLRMKLRKQPLKKVTIGQKDLYMRCKLQDTEDVLYPEGNAIKRVSDLGNQKWLLEIAYKPKPITTTKQINNKPKQ